MLQHSIIHPGKREEASTKNNDDNHNRNKLEEYDDTVLIMFLLLLLLLFDPKEDVRSRIRIGRLHGRIDPAVPYHTWIYCFGCDGTATTPTTATLSYVPVW
jgi:hypothetical protein